MRFTATEAVFPLSHGPQPAKLVRDSSMGINISGLKVPMQLFAPPSVPPTQSPRLAGFTILNTGSSD